MLEPKRYSGVAKRLGPTDRPSRFYFSVALSIGSTPRQTTEAKRLFTNRMILAELPR